jgi:hypothetical protein
MDFDERGQTAFGSSKDEVCKTIAEVCKTEPSKKGKRI